MIKFNEFGVNLHKNGKCLHTIVQIIQYLDIIWNFTINISINVFEPSFTCANLPNNKAIFENMANIKHFHNLNKRKEIIIGFSTFFRRQGQTYIRIAKDRGSIQWIFQSKRTQQGQVKLTLGTNHHLIPICKIRATLYFSSIKATQPIWDLKQDITLGVRKRVIPGGSMFRYIHWHVDSP